MKTKALMFILVVAAGITFSFTGWAQTAGAQSAAEKRALFMRGAELWPVYCNTCHNARPGPEFSPSEWNMIMMHMRTQANLPAQDARAILEYLKGSR
ncbi:MAG: cytochrome c [Candidatus Binataceae bacterium]|nr:cytochrome c [Candidatus Binataceae bacterium]